MLIAISTGIIAIFGAYGVLRCYDHAFEKARTSLK